MLRACRRAAAAAALLSISTGSFAGREARGETWIVDDDGRANFRDLPAAVAAAKDGDTLILRPGRYEAVSLERKGLRVIGCGPRRVTIERTSGEGPFFAARELTGRQQVVLSGVTGIGRGATITIERCSGLVLLADLVVTSRHPSRAGTGPMLSDCANAVLARVAVLPDERTGDGAAYGMSLARGSYALTQVVAVGSTGAPARSPRGRGGTGAVGLAVEDAKVAIARSEFVGGDGGPALWDQGAPFCPEAATGGVGGAGVYVGGDSEVLLVGCGAEQVRGGNGGAASRNPWDRCWSFAGDGGPGVRVGAEDAAARVRLSGVSAQAGRAGEGDAARAGKDGVAIDGAPDSVTTAGDDERLPSLAIDEPAVCGGSLTLRVSGPPGARVTLIVSSVIDPISLKGRRGFPLLAAPGGFFGVCLFGRLDEDGQLVLSAKVPADRDVAGRSYVLQALVASAASGRRETYLTNADVIAIADGTAGSPVVDR